MEDKSTSQLVFKIIKGIILILILGVIVFLIFYFMSHGNSQKIKDYFQENQYTLNDDTWTKSINNTDNNQTTSINYIYNTKLNIFTKNTDTASEDTRLYFSSQYDGKNILNITLDTTIIGENSCKSIQSATYNYKNKKFNCEIISTKGKCETMCDKLKEEAENFSKEIQNIIETAKLPHNMFS